MAAWGGAGAVWLSSCSVLLVLAASPTASVAAMRVCQSEISSGLQKGKTEQEARALAVASWNRQAAAYGDGYAWTGAINKFLNCSAGADGAHQCLAKALPCTIFQVPLPPGTFRPAAPGGVKG